MGRLQHHRSMDFGALRSSPSKDISGTIRGRQPRLRASCDGCFLAKVKCSKARPICSRCLACGIECRYSPSSRAGKPKADQNPGNLSIPPLPDMPTISPMPDGKDMLFTPHPDASGHYKLDTSWEAPVPMGHSLRKAQSIATGLHLLAMDDTSPRDQPLPLDMYGVGMPWISPPDLSPSRYQHMAMTSGPGPSHHDGAIVMDMSMAPHLAPPWMDTGPTVLDLPPYSSPTGLPTPASVISQRFHSPPTPTPASVTPSRPKPQSADPMASGCKCFSVCLESLEALHNASEPAPPPIDVVLALNRKAVDGCSKMLSCSQCMRRAGPLTAAMLLATVIGKVAFFYKNASRTYFENGSNESTRMATDMGNTCNGGTTGLGVSLGAYTLGGEEGRWLELEILNREVRKLEDLYGRFREAYADPSDSAEMIHGIIGYLGQSLSGAVESVNLRKDDGVQAQ